jgi:hypothetical protein
MWQRWMQPTILIGLAVHGLAWLLWMSRAPLALVIPLGYMGLIIVTIGLCNITIGEQGQGERA